MGDDKAANSVMGSRERDLEVLIPVGEHGPADCSDSKASGSGSSSPPHHHRHHHHHPSREDCIGFIDGTHIEARVSTDLVSKLQRRKGIPPTLNAPMDCEPINTSAHRQEVSRSSTSKSNARTSCTSRLNNANVAQSTIADKLGELVTSINNTKKKTWKEKFSDALWSMEDYNDEDMDMVFERLRVNKDLAESFYLRKPSLRKLWQAKEVVKAAKKRLQHKNPRVQFLALTVRDKIFVLLDLWQEAFGGPGGKYPQYMIADLSS